MVDLLGFGACLRWWFFRKSFCCRRQCSPPPTHTAYQNFLVPPPPVDMASVLMVLKSYHCGIIWTRFLGGGFPWAYQGLVLLRRCGGVLLVIHWFCGYHHHHHHHHGCRILCLTISIHPIPHCVWGIHPHLQPPSWDFHLHHSSRDWEWIHCRYHPRSFCHYLCHRLHSHLLS